MLARSMIDTGEADKPRRVASGKTLSLRPHMCAQAGSKQAADQSYMAKILTTRPHNGNAQVYNI